MSVSSARDAVGSSIDEIIAPELLRPRLVMSLEMLRDKRESNPPRKHGNIPL